MTTLAAVSHETMAPRLPTRPYPGLRPFEIDEWPFFFGRNEMVDEVIDHLAERCLLLVHGSSGSGKSSLIRAGVLPRLQRQHRRNRLGWSTAAMRPAGGPLWNLAEALVARDRRPAEAEDVDALRRRFDRETANLRSIVSDLPDMKGSRLCLLVDQFEELFQYIHEGSVEEATLFVDLIASALEDDAASPVRVILTMRSDFLGECVRWPKLAEAVNRAQYLLPPMGQAALQEAICRPAELYQGKVDLALADRMIGDAQGEQDQLPLIQHALMRLWDLTTVENGARHLDSSLYEKHGPLTRILDEHADEVARIAEPGTNDLPTVSGVFRALSDLNDAGQPIRRQQTLKDLSAVTGAAEDNVRAVVDAFRADGVSFLKPYGREMLDDREPIDISHEALMRCWKRLADRGTGWLWDEFRQGLAWTSLLAQAELFLKDSRNVLSPPTTEDRQHWLSSRTEAWATRYGDSWSKVAALMDASRAYAHRQRRNLRLLTSGLILLALLVTGGIIWGRGTYYQATQAQYNATQALDKLYTEQARVMWSEIGSSSDNWLAPRQLYALWQVADSEPKVREKFVKLLSEEPELAARFGIYAAVISRAIGLDWPQTAEQAHTVLKRSRDAIGETSDENQLGALPQAVEALAPWLTAEQAAAELASVFDMIGKTTDVPRANALWSTIHALVPRLTEEQAQSEFGLVLDALGKMTDAYQLQVLALAARELAPRLPAGQRGSALARLLEVIVKASNPFALGWLAQAVATLGPTADQAQTVLGRVFDAIGDLENTARSDVLLEAVKGLSPRLTAEAALIVLDAKLDVIGKTRDYSALENLSQIVVAVAPSLTAEQAQTRIAGVLDAIKETTNPDQLRPLAQAVSALVLRLTTDQAQVGLDAIGKITDPDQLIAIVQAVPAAAPRLTAEQAQVVLDAIGKSTSLYRLSAILPAVSALAPRLTADQAQATLVRILDMMRKPTDWSQRTTLAQAVSALAPRLTADQAQATLPRILDMMGKNPDRSQLGALAQAVSALSPRPEQLQAALDRVFDATDKFPYGDLDLLWKVVQEDLAPRLTAGQAHAAIQRALDMIGKASDSNQARAVSQTVPILASRLTREEYQDALGRVLDAAGKTSSLDVRGSLAAAVQELAPRLTAEQAEPELGRVRSALGWSANSEEAQQWAKAFVALLERSSGPNSVSKVLIEAMKFPIVAEKPSDELLAALQKHMTSLPGPTAGLRANLDWLKQNDPSIDLNSPAICPPPPREELRCP